VIWKRSKDGIHWSVWIVIEPILSGSLFKGKEKVDYYNFIFPLDTFPEMKMFGDF
jgi:hypothetical protein